jgi:hypothetical protein
MTSAPASQKLTRSMLISQDLEKIAAASPTMYIGTPDHQGVMLVPTPASVAMTGIIPEGFSIGMSSCHISCHFICIMTCCIRLGLGPRHCPRCLFYGICFISLHLIVPSKIDVGVCSRFPQETIEALKAIMNSPDNVKIVPTSIYENVCSFFVHIIDRS